MAPTVTMYATSWCGFCYRARRFLDENNVVYTEIDIDQDEEAAERVQAWNNGNRTVPTIDFGGTVLTNPSPAQMRELLGL